MGRARVRPWASSPDVGQDGDHADHHSAKHEEADEGGAADGTAGVQEAKMEAEAGGEEEGEEWPDTPPPPQEGAASPQGADENKEEKEEEDDEEKVLKEEAAEEEQEDGSETPPALGAHEEEQEASQGPPESFGTEQAEEMEADEEPLQEPMTLGDLTRRAAQLGIFTASSTPNEEEEEDEEEDPQDGTDTPPLPTRPPPPASPPQQPAAAEAQVEEAEVEEPPPGPVPDEPSPPPPAAPPASDAGSPRPDAGGLVTWGLPMELLATGSSTTSTTSMQWPDGLPQAFGAAAGSLPLLQMGGGAQPASVTITMNVLHLSTGLLGNHAPGGQGPGAPAAQAMTPEQPAAAPAAAPMAEARPSAEPLPPAAPAAAPPAAAGEGRLALVLDLDMTLVHARKVSEFQCPLLDVDRYVNERNERELFEWEGSGESHYVKLRPGVREFLSDLQPLFDLFVVSMGGEAYVDFVLSILDPARTFFPSHRVASRADFEGAQRKSCRRICPQPPGRILVFDDEPRIWDDQEVTCIRAFKYTYLKDCEKELTAALIGHSRGDPLPRDRDAVLPNAVRLFREIHRGVVEQGLPSIRTAQDAVWARIFRDLRICFLADDEGAKRAVRIFGCTIESEVTADVHIVVAQTPASHYQRAVQRAQALEVPRVSMKWLTLCFATWAVQDPRPFAIEAPTRNLNIWDVYANFFTSQSAEVPSLCRPNNGAYDLLEKWRRRRLGLAAAPPAAAARLPIGARSASRTPALRAAPRGGDPAAPPAQAGDVWEDLPAPAAADEDVVIDLG